MDDGLDSEAQMPTMPASPKIKSMTKINMASLELYRVSFLINDFHVNFVKAQAHRDPKELQFSFKILRQSYSVWRPVLNKGQKKHLDERFKEIFLAIAQTIEAAKRDPNEGGVKFDQAVGYVDDLLDKYYELKQTAGLGIPTERSRDDESRLQDLVQ